MSLTRRVFVRWSAAVSAFVAAVGRPARAASGPGAWPDAEAGFRTHPTQGLAAPELLPLAQAVLPAELGAGGIQRATNEFAAWIAGYREHAEVLHSYGSDRITFTGPSPAAKWAAQLAALNAAARTQHGKAFRACTVAERTALVESVVEGAQRGARVPNVAGAPHVALALLAHFLDSPAATNLAYNRVIDPRQCRPLGASVTLPVALRRGASRGGTGGGR